MEQKYLIENAKDSQQVTQFLGDQIYIYNSNKIGRHDGNIFAKVVKDKNGTIIAGISAWTWAFTCEISLLWVSENLRKNGIGKKLLLAAEQEAIAKKCSIIRISSYSFQSPSFYEKNGYKIEHVLNNFPAGYKDYILTKRL
jgi:GNAT superfamily N-acetyltransferase